MTKPCPIPRDLLPGDVVICNDGSRWIAFDMQEGCGAYFPDGDLKCGSPSKYSNAARTFKPDGSGWNNKEWFAVRIERIASAKPHIFAASDMHNICSVCRQRERHPVHQRDAKPKKAKVDRDAKWLIQLAEAYTEQYRELGQRTSVPRRLRAIARRLEGGK